MPGALARELVTAGAASRLDPLTVVSNARALLARRQSVLLSNFAAPLLSWAEVTRDDARALQESVDTLTTLGDEVGFFLGERGAK